MNFRGAIKFGDFLERGECLEILENLKKCKVYNYYIILFSYHFNAVKIIKYSARKTKFNTIIEDKQF